MQKLFLGAFLGLLTGALGAAEVPYPTGYREWRHLGGITSHPKDRADAPFGLIHHLYGNEKALEGLRTGTFPEGAVFVADWFLLKEKYPGSFDEGTRDRTDVMIKDASFAATGGWGYDQFAKDSQVIRNVGGKMPNQCFECHTKVKKRDYVFTTLRP